MNIPIWSGTSTFAPGQTPFGFYDNDTDFQVDANKVANFCAQRMGYPLVDVELQSGSFFTAFEEAVTTYGNEIYAYKIRDNQLSIDGLPTSSLLNNALITPSFEPIVRLSEQYGEEAGSGGNVNYYSGSFDLTSSIQDYSFETFMTSSGLTGSEYMHGIEVKRVFYENPYPAGARFLGANNGFGFGGVMASGIMGLGGFGAEGGYLMAPLNYDIAVIQQIEMSETIRRNQYSFEIRNNNLRIFPINVGQDNLKKTSDFFDELKIKNLKPYFDSPETLAKKFGLRGIPTSILFSKDGLEFARIIGSINFEDERFIKWLSKYN